MIHVVTNGTSGTLSLQVSLLSPGPGDEWGKPYGIFSHPCLFSGSRLPARLPLAHDAAFLFFWFECGPRRCESTSVPLPPPPAGVVPWFTDHGLPSPLETSWFLSFLPNEEMNFGSGPRISPPLSRITIYFPLVVFLLFTGVAPLKERLLAQISFSPPW